MGTPGSGRYTTYLPIKSSKTDMLLKLFKGGFGAIYNNKESNSDAASEAVAIAKNVLNGVGDSDMFGNGVDLNYGGAPNTAEVAWSKAGDPANAYVPDISSPGPGKTSPEDKDVDPKIAAEDIKPGFDTKNPSVNTTPPNATSRRLGTLSLGENLQGGKSSIE